MPQVDPNNPVLREPKQSLAQVIAARSAKNEPENPAMVEIQKQLEEQKAQTRILQQQLEQNRKIEFDKVNETKAAKDAEEAAKLAEEADLKQTLNMLEGDKYDQLTNKEIIDVIATAVEGSLDARGKQFNQILEARVGDLAKQITNTQKAIMQVATTIDVKEVKSVHKDFDTYQKDAAIIMQDNPGISVERAYLLAKAEAAAKVPPKEELDRERPDTSVSRSSIDNSVNVIERNDRRKSSASERKTGIAGIRSIIDAGIDTVQARRGEL